MLLSLAEKKKYFWILVVSVIFIAINSVLTAREFYYFNLVPLGLLLIYLAFWHMDILVYSSIIFVPLSIELSYFTNIQGVDISLPTEPIIIGITLMFILKLLREKHFDNKILNHPISLAIFFHLAWMLITTITSTMPVVSIKYFLVRFWYIAVFYFLLTQLFTRYKNMIRFYWCYILPFLIVIGYKLVRQSAFGFFDQQTAHFTMQPFYNDHTSYGAMLAMFFPVLLGIAFIKRKSSMSRNLFNWTVITIFFFSILLSYTRAAWLSLIVALAVYIILIFKIRFITLFTAGLVVLAIAYSYRTEIYLKLQKNKQTSSTDITEHVKSMSNIASDVSNLERINRWQAALRMFKDKPVFGFGPGTYMFQYAPYQMTIEKTPISTNAGDMGNAHSEYIGALSESGVLGMLSFMIIAVLIIYTGFRVFQRTNRRKVKILSMVTLLGLITYLTHGFLNNFLDTDKAAVPFWGFTAIIVALDVYFGPKKEIEKK